MGLAFVFPGQGSQSVGMLADLAVAYPIVKQTFAEASEVLDYDLWQLVQEGPDEQLNQTHITQPAMLAAGVANWHAWQSAGGATPQVMAGHSLGEYSALVCAGALSFADAVTLVTERGRFMQEAVPAGIGAMAAILGLDDGSVAEACRRAAGGEVVAPVNFNSPGQVVVAGSKAAVERALLEAKEAGAKRAVLLPVSVPSHCALMRPAAERLAALLAEVTIAVPSIPVLNNVDVAVASSPEAIRDALVRQLYSPVRWVETVHALAAQGVYEIVECGPGKVLTGLNKRIEKGMKAAAIFDPAALNALVTEANEEERVE